MSPLIVGSGSTGSEGRSDRLGLPTGTSDPGTAEAGDLYYKTDTNKIRYHDGTQWNDLASGGGGAADDPGPGGGISIQNGAVNTAGVLTTTSSTFYSDSWIDSQGAAGDPLDYNASSFGFHTGHNGNSTHWPFHFAVRVSTSIAGAVADQIEWKKHSNACGNVDVYGSNNSITASNFTQTGNYTYLGRIHCGGNGSAADFTVISENFNPEKYGYQWIMFKVQDINGPGSNIGENGNGELPFSLIGTLQGWAMYGFRVRCTGVNTYATLGNHTSGGTLSNGDLTFAMGSGAHRTESTANVAKGKWYWEALANSGTTNGTVGGRVGVCCPANENNPESVRLGIVWHATAGIQRHIRTGGTTTFTTVLTGTNYGDGDRIGVALDMDNDTIQFYKNGTLAYNYDFSGDATGTRMEFAAHCWNGSSGTPSWTYNFGQSPFIHNVPTGYNAGLWK